MLEVEDTDPPRVSFSLPWLPVPADAAVIGFDVDTATRSSVIREVAAALVEEYVLPEHAAAMADALIEKLESGGYDDVTNGWVLANVLTQDLRSVYDDKHLVVGFSPIEAGPPMPGLFAVQPTQVGASCGLERPQDLEDGIGYVKISLFADPSTCGAEAIDALASLRSTRAIVFDLRDAVGGHAGMVALMLAHLFDEAPDMSSLHRRSSVSEFSLPFAGFNLADKLVYILTSERTFSAAEWFAYDLQALDRATIVGAATGGGAHAARLERIDERFQVNLPYARAVNPITAENWEKTGVIPDVSAEASDALDVALALIRRAEER